MHRQKLLSGLQEYDTLLLKTGDVSRYVQQSIRNGSDEWEHLVGPAFIYKPEREAETSSTSFSQTAASKSLK